MFAQRKVLRSTIQNRPVARLRDGKRRSLPFLRSQVSTYYQPCQSDDAKYAITIDCAMFAGHMRDILLTLVYSLGTFVRYCYRRDRLYERLSRRSWDETLKFDDTPLRRFSLALAGSFVQNKHIRPRIVFRSFSNEPIRASAKTSVASGLQRLPVPLLHGHISTFEQRPSRQVFASALQFATDRRIDCLMG